MTGTPPHAYHLTCVTTERGYQVNASPLPAMLVLALIFLPLDAGAKEVRTFSDDAIELKADCVPGEAGEGICATCAVKATNRTDDVLGRGDITVSIRRGVSDRAKGSKKTSKRILPKGSKIMNDDKNIWMKSEDHIVQALRDDWRVHEEITLTVEIAAEKGAGCADPKPHPSLP